MQNDMSIYVITHKQYHFPKDTIYHPIQVGKNEEIDSVSIRDNTGDNIAAKNGDYCELTAYYWIWKNDKRSKYIGICHYRRYFTKNPFSEKDSYYLKYNDITSKLREHDIILPIKTVWKNKTIEEMYDYGRRPQDLHIIHSILQESFPEYLPEYEKVIYGNCSHYRNMLITTKTYFDSYCTWLFPILFETEKRLKDQGEQTGDTRIFGYISEFLLDVWILKNRLRIIEVPIVTTDKTLKQRLVNYKNIIKRGRLPKYGKQC